MTSRILPKTIGGEAGGVAGGERHEEHAEGHAKCPDAGDGGVLTDAFGTAELADREGSEDGCTRAERIGLMPR